MARRIKDVELRMYRAFDHLKELHEEIEGWIDGDHHRVIRRYYAKRREYVTYAEVERVPKRFAILVGDALYSLRASLDSLAYELAATFTRPLPKDVAEDSEFPIFGDEDRKGRANRGATMFSNHLKSPRSKIRGIDPLAQAIIESLQPYKLGANFRTHPLWWLHELARIDRHRLIHTTAMHSGGALLQVDDAAKAIASAITGHAVTEGPVEGRTAVVRVWFVDGFARNPKVDMPFTPSLDVAFARSPVPGANQRVRQTLWQIYEFIKTEVLPPFTPYLGKARAPRL